MVPVWKAWQSARTLQLPSVLFQRMFFLKYNSTLLQLGRSGACKSPFKGVFKNLFCKKSRKMRLPSRWIGAHCFIDFRPCCLNFIYLLFDGFHIMYLISGEFLDRSKNKKYDALEPGMSDLMMIYGCRHTAWTHGIKSIGARHCSYNLGVVAHLIPACMTIYQGHKVLHLCQQFYHF